MTYPDCPVCHEPVHPAAGTSHSMCAPWADDADDAEAVALKHQLMQIILWAEQQNPRSRQVEIGPSEIGAVCDRQIGYRVAQVAACNTGSDPWPAIVGTAMHSWLKDAVDAWNLRTSDPLEWLTEIALEINPLVHGHGDLFNIPKGMVIDHKGAGVEVMRQVRKDGPKPEHEVQVQLYGLGYQARGFAVKKVAIVYYPRAGWLRDAYVWVDDFRPEIAYAALDRLGQISRLLVNIDVLNNPHRWEQVSATPSNACGLCDWYDPGRHPDKGPDNTGCPGK